MKPLAFRLKVMPILLTAAIYTSWSVNVLAAPLSNLNLDSIMQNGQSVFLRTIDNQHVKIDFINSHVFRLQASHNDIFTDVKTDAVNDQCANFKCDNSDFNAEALPNIVINDQQGHVAINVSQQGEYHLITTDALALRVYHAPLTFALYKSDNMTPLWRELQPIDLGASVDGFDQSELKFYNSNLKTVQTLSSSKDEHFYGGGQQNGEFEFNGKILKASYSGGWEEFDRPSPAPFYFSDKGYGVLRHTWRNGAHDFRSIDQAVSSYNENRFDAYYFVGETLHEIVDHYTNLTGRPHLMARWAYYLGDADCYQNKNGAYPSGWPDSPGNTRDVVDQVAIPYKNHDMPVGWILPNDGYGCGYSDLAGTVSELDKLGIQTGLWTQKSLDQIRQEVSDGVKVYKLDVAWTGPGKLYSLAANNDAHIGLMENSTTRGMIWTVMGWAGTQRYSVTWTGDQAASWDYIRWHIPTFIGSGLSGQAYASSDVNGIFGSGAETFTRDLQFKTFTPVLISMSGWDRGERKHAWWHDGDFNGKLYRDINRDYLMLKSALMPYMYHYAYQADQSGSPLVRAMTWEFPDDARLKSEEFKYQYMYGESLLVAPVYEPMAKNNGWYKQLYLPTGEWIDFWDGTRTSVPDGGKVLEYYPVTIDRIPVLVRAGAIIPMYQGARSDALQDQSHVIMQVFPHGESHFTLYEDDGETRAYREQNAYAETQIHVQAPRIGTPGNITITIEPAVIHHAYDGQINQRSYHIQVSSLIAPQLVKHNNLVLNQHQTQNDFAQADEGWFFDSSDKNGVVHIKLPKQSVYEQQQVMIDIDEAAIWPETLPYPQPNYHTEFDKSLLKIVKPMPAEPGTPFVNALDGDVASLYHSPWEPTEPSEQTPMDFIVQLGGTFNVSGFTYLPDEMAGNGTITQYRLYLSTTNGNWGEPVAEGTWPQTEALKIADFSETEASYLRFEVVAASGGFVSAREFDIIATKKRTPTKTIELTEDHLTIEGEVKVGSSVTGSEMQMNGLNFQSGIGMQAPANVSFSLDGTWTRLTADVGIDDSCKIEGNKVKASVYADGVKVWEYDLEGPAVVKPDLDLYNIKHIILRTDDIDNDVTGDCVNWANLKLTGPETATFNEFDRTAIRFIEKPKAQSGSEIEKAFDGDLNSIYHSPWFPEHDSEKAPQHFVIDLSADFMVSGFSYVARPGAGNGAIGDYRLSLSEDGQNFIEVSVGTFEHRDGVQKLEFSPYQAKYLKFEALSGVGDFVSAAEFDVFAQKVKNKNPIEPELSSSSGGSMGLFYLWQLFLVGLVRYYRSKFSFCDPK
ncbi:discoidin domain-containing protein [Vibrio metschnikovii]|nr:discoidin domain-containing protein [Vibrio metschnikovii]EKO3736264.1 discoidin domain-containing protein [Vibrio metschnikovii]EKO3746710.1 discoidin domain-containing protein [Vibrio metschnikovii]